MTSANGMAAAIGHGRATDEREIVITRLIDAPRDLVFAAWTDARHVAQWWRPKVMADVRLEEMEVKPGGLLRLSMTTPEGVTYTSRCVYREITAPERLSYDETCDQGGKVFHRAHHAISFEAQGAKTLLTLHAHLELVPDRDPSWTLEMMRAGWSAGWKDNLDLLDGYLPRATFLETPGRELVLRRLVQAPRELVFRAWADPAQMAQWWGPKAFTNPVCEGDVRVGGAWRVVMRGPDGAEYPLSGTYLEIAPPERLVMRMNLDQHPREFHERIRAYRAAHPADDAGYDGEIVMALSLEDRGGATWMTMRQRFGSAAERNAHREMGAIAGWSESFERLAACLPAMD